VSEKAGGPGWFAGRGEKEREVGQLGLNGKGERGRGKGFLFLNIFSNSFSNFQTSTKKETMNSNHDTQALIISNFIQWMFKYFKSQFI
jgi:hypothetical protein